MVCVHVAPRVPPLSFICMVFSVIVCGSVCFLSFFQIARMLHISFFSSIAGENKFLFADLRRLNMRSMVGRKDVFLSYAHINVEFALRVKVSQSYCGLCNTRPRALWTFFTEGNE